MRLDRPESRSALKENWMRRQFVLALLATTFQVLLQWGLMLVDSQADPVLGDTPLWYSLLQGPFNGIAAVLPCIALGYLAKRNGMLLGAVCGLLSGPVLMGLVLAHWGSFSATPETFALLASGAFGTAVVSAVSGGTGELLACRASAGNALKAR
jgi:hypothetical protein